MKQPVTITLNPLDRHTADSIILNYADDKDYKISYKYIKSPASYNKPSTSQYVEYFFIINNKKIYAGIYNYKTNQLTYKAL